RPLDDAPHAAPRPWLAVFAIFVGARHVVPANMLGYLRTIRLGNGAIESWVLRLERSAGFFSPALSAGKAGVSGLLPPSLVFRESVLPVHPSCLLALSAANMPCLPQATWRRDPGRERSEWSPTKKTAPRLLP